MVDAALFSSVRMDWETPPDLFAAIADVYGPFKLDAAASVENAKAARFYTTEDDGLQQPWDTVTWCNPPYGDGVGVWCRKAWQEVHVAARCPRAVLLIPSRTDTSYWHQYVMRASIVKFIQGRVTFVGAEAGAPFPSAVIVWDWLRGWPPQFASWGSAPAPQIGLL